MFIFLCSIAWVLYDAHKWRALDKHRATCKECFKKQLDTL